MDAVTAQVLGICIAIIIPLIFVAVMLKDNNSRHIILYFCWGTFAGFLAYLGNNYFAGLPGQAARVQTSIAPIVEEAFKALPLIMFLNKRKYPQFGAIIIYCALASGAGFSIQESIYYFSMSSGTPGSILTLIVRTLTTALMHGMATAIMGFGLVILQKQRHILIPVVFGLLTLSTSVHALYNLLLPTNGLIIAALMPIGLYFAGLVFLKNMKTENQKQV